MKIIYNKFFPFGKFWATNVFGIIFCRKDKGMLRPRDINHEYIHSLQQREMLFIGFAIWYYIEWLYRAIRLHSFMRGYYAIYFEREAYTMEHDLDYRHHRRHFEWWYMFVKEGSLLHEVGCFLRDVFSFVRDDLRPAKLLYAVLLIAAVIIGQIKFNLYGILIQPSYLNNTSMLRVAMVYVSMYYIALIPTVLLSHEGWRLRQWQVWVLPAFLVAVDGAGQGFDTYKTWIAESGLGGHEQYYLKIVGSFLFRSVAVLSILILFRKIVDGRFGLYGLRRSRKYIRVYALIFVILLPVFVVVSSTQQFLDFYPKMAIQYCSGAFHQCNALLIAGFELCYANDFLCVESMFRGALVIGLMRWLGPRAVLPMALTYMCIHLGKPDLELCSSVIGGYTLGVLAYRTQHLWGGIMIHLGIALLFEALGLMHLLG